MKKSTRNILFAPLKDVGNSPLDRLPTFQEVLQELVDGVGLTREQLGLPLPEPTLNTCGVCGVSGLVVRFCGGLVIREGSVTPWMCADCLKKEAPPMLYVTLFIAPDGDFRHVTPHNMDLRTLRKLHSMRTTEGPDGEPVVEANVKLYARHTLAIPKEDVEKVQIGAWPSLEWDEFLRGVIRDLEAKGDAPWKTKSQ